MWHSFKGNSSSMFWSPSREYSIWKETYTFYNHDGFTHHIYEPHYWGAPMMNQKMHHKVCDGSTHHEIWTPNLGFIHDEPKSLHRIWTPNLGFNKDEPNPFIKYEPQIWGSYFLQRVHEGFMRLHKPIEVLYLTSSQRSIQSYTKCKGYIEHC